MYAIRNLAPTWALSLLLVACSSNGKGGASDGGSHDGGLTIDTNLTVPDGALSRDARDVATEAAARFDGVTGLDTTKPGDTRDGASPSEAGGIDGPGALDTTKPGDTKDGAKASDAADAPLSDAKDAPINKDALDTAAIDSPPGNGCENAIEISLDELHTDMTVTTDGESHAFDLPCAAGGKDIVLSFYLDRTEMVYADTFGSTWDTILAFSPTCPVTAPKPVDGMIDCNDDACATKQSQAFAILPNGRHFLVLSGGNDESGSATIHFHHAPVALSNNQNLAEGTGTLTGTNSGSGVLAVCEASGPETCYWWVSCPEYAGGSLKASTCTGTTFDVVMSLQIPRTNAVSCANGDSCGLQEAMSTTIPPGAGMHVLTVDGDVRTSTGDYTLVYTRP